MCGLVGFFGDLSHQERRMFRTLLILDTLRGEDSTGVFIADQNGNYDLVKSVGVPFDLFYYANNLKEFGDQPKLVVRNSTFEKVPEKFFDHSGVVDFTTPRLLMGHNRLATIGEINAETAHPFDFEHIVGAHNGTLNKSFLNKCKSVDLYTVDSQVMFHELNETQSLDDLWAKLDGAAALTIWHKETKSLNLIRNDKRPLFFIRSNDGKKIMWASKREFIVFVLNHHSVAHLWDWKEMVDLTPHYHYSFQMGGTALTPTVVEAEPRKLQHFFVQPTYYPPRVVGKVSENRHGKSVSVGKSNSSGLSYKVLLNRQSKGCQPHSVSQPSVITPSTQPSIDFSRPFYMDKDMRGVWTNPRTGETRQDKPDYITDKSVGYYYKTVELGPNAVQEKTVIRHYVEVCTDHILGGKETLVPSRVRFRCSDKTTIRPFYISPTYPVILNSTTVEGLGVFGQTKIVGPFDSRFVKGMSVKESLSLFWDDKKRMWYSFERPTDKLFDLTERAYDVLYDYVIESLEKETTQNPGRKFSETVQLPYFDDQTVSEADLAGMFNEGWIDPCDHCGGLPDPEVWKDLTWTDWQTFECPGKNECVRKNLDTVFGSETGFTTNDPKTIH